MPKLYSSKDIIKVLEKEKFIFISQKGSHIKYRKHGRPSLTVIIPANRREIPLVLSVRSCANLVSRNLTLRNSIEYRGR